MRNKSYPKQNEDERIKDLRRLFRLTFPKEGIVGVFKASNKIKSRKELFMRNKPYPKQLRFEIYKDIRKEYRWRLVAANGKIIAQGEGYTTKSHLKKTIKKIQEFAAESDIFDCTLKENRRFNVRL